MAEIRVLLADDEPLAIENLAVLLRAETDMKIVARCRNGRETLAAIREAEPDIAFLDIRMPEGTGLDVATSIAESGAGGPLVVFVTAYDEWAVRAFEAEAVDYVVKPVRETRFRTTLRRVRERLTRESELEVARTIHSLVRRLSDGADGYGEADVGRSSFWPDRIRVRTRDRTSFVLLREVLWIEAHRSGVRLHTDSAAIPHRESLSELEGRLDPARWIRIHRSHIVQVDSIREIQPYFHGDYMVILEDRTRIRMSRRRRKAIARLLGQRDEDST